MKIISTRDSQRKVTFSEALFQGLSPEGGLFVPEEMKDLSSLYQSFTSQTPFSQMAGEIIYYLLDDTFTKNQAMILARKAFNFEPKLVNLENNISVLELFHGPSCAFKDFGASFLAHSMETLLKKEDKKAVILTATSGDTGSAVAQAFAGKDNVDVVILYPSGRVSPLQEKQLTTIGGNISALEVKGSFDDCQRMVKEAFTDKELKKRINFSSANSINMGRLIPQSFYYAWAYTRIFDKTATFVVPSGNFGNLTAGLYAKNWGLNISHFVAATNINDTVHRYLSSGIYKENPSIHTISNAMDVGAPSNYERMINLFKGDRNSMSKLISSYSIDDKTTKETIKDVYENEGYIMCPHTAVAYKAACEEQKRVGAKTNMIVLSTAHPGKFSEVIEDVIGIKPTLPESLESMRDKEKKSYIISNDLPSLRKHLYTIY